MNTIEKLTIDKNLEAKSAASALARLYEKPLAATRSGALYNAFSYPTKISPESIALFIATHTKPGEVVLDAFAGSGTTGLATLLCDAPTDNMLQIASKMGISPKWGPRTAHLMEVGVLGSFISQVLCKPPEPKLFAKAAAQLIADAKKELGWLYKAKNPEGVDGYIRHAIWSDILICRHCQNEVPYWDAAVRFDPLKMVSSFTCPYCKEKIEIDSCNRATETVEDTFSRKPVTQKKRVLARIYGQSGKTKWSRPPTDDDYELYSRINMLGLPETAPNQRIEWGDLRRSGYHKGIESLHHFYTRRNFFVLSTLWEMISAYDAEIQNALKMLVLSYNASHSTLMTRVVVKKGQKDLVLTGAQSGVLYVSGLPVEKNILEGISKKAKALAKAFDVVHKSTSSIFVHNSSSESIPLPEESVDYVFTDPPFGGNIPYAEINQINELWLGATTSRENEIIISSAQGKKVNKYGKMMSSVFSEISRVLKPNGLATVVFHSAQSDVWKALSKAYVDAGMAVQKTSILDKIQASFKQVVSKISVKGDPLLLLSKGQTVTSQISEDAIAKDIIAKAVSSGDSEKNPQRLYSLYVSRCLEQGKDSPLDAREFYGRATQALGAEQ
mgnify:CR=1 FL=1